MCVCASGSVCVCACACVCVCVWGGVVCMCVCVCVCVCVCLQVCTFVFCDCVLSYVSAYLSVLECSVSVCVSFVRCMCAVCAVFVQCLYCMPVCVCVSACVGGVYLCGKVQCLNACLRYDISSCDRSVCVIRRKAEQWQRMSQSDVLWGIFTHIFTYSFSTTWGSKLSQIEKRIYTKKTHTF